MQSDSKKMMYNVCMAYPVPASSAKLCEAKRAAFIHAAKRVHLLLWHLRGAPSFVLMIPFVY